MIAAWPYGDAAISDARECVPNEALSAFGTRAMPVPTGLWAPRTGHGAVTAVRSPVSGAW